MRLTSFGLLVVLLGLSVWCLPALAQDVYILTNTTIDASNSIPGNAFIGTTSLLRLGLNTSPTVNLVSGGSIGSVRVYNSSTFNMTGGATGTSVLPSIQAWDTSTINISGGILTTFVVANDSSTVNMTGGSIAQDLDGDGTATSVVTVSGGTIAGTLYAGNSTVNLKGGTVQNFESLANANGISTMSGGVVTNGLASIGSGILNVTGGTIGYSISMGNNGTINLYGGTINSTTSVQVADSGTLNLYGYGLSQTLLGTSGGQYIPGFGFLPTFTDWQLAGKLLDGSSVNGLVVDVQNSNATLNLFNSASVPENNTLAIALIGLTVIALKGRSRAHKDT